MEENKLVFLLVGTRAAGKTTYAKRLLEKDPSLELVCRDEILAAKGMENLYSVPERYVHEVVEKELRGRLVAPGMARVILDYWTGSGEERKAVIRWAKDLGATNVIALVFETPVELVEQWFWKKPGIARMSEMRRRNGEPGIGFYSDNAPRHDHELFQAFSRDIDRDGFDRIIRVNPLNELICLPSCC